MQEKEKTNASSAHVEESIQKFYDSHAAEEPYAVLVAFSGGPDSTALLHALVSQKKNHDVTISACHVDHSIRDSEERLREKHIVRKICKSLEVVLDEAELHDGAVEGISRDTGGIEAAARKLRYEELEKARERASARFLLVAHNRNDFRETVIMNILRGSSPRGLGGIKRSYGPVERPLLDVPRDDIEQYLAENGLDFSFDSTNDSLEYSRNKVRHSLIPLLECDFPGYGTALDMFAEKQADAALMIDEIALEPHFHDIDEGRYPLRVWKTLPFAGRIAVLEALIPDTRKHIRIPYRLLKAAAMKKETGNTVLASGAGVRFETAGDWIVARIDIDFRLSDGYCVSFECPGIVVAGCVRIAAELTDDPNGIRVSAFDFPIVVRSPKPGDGISMPRGAKCLDDLFREWKIPIDDRHAIPVIEDRRGIVAVLGSRKGYRNRFRHEAAGKKSPGDLFLAIDVQGV